MQWIAPSEKDIATDTLEKRLWAAADQLRANSGLTSTQYSQPVLGLIFLRFAEVRFAAQRKKMDKGKAKTKRADSVLFIDARHIYRQVDRAHRDWTPMCPVYANRLCWPTSKLQVGH